METVVGLLGLVVLCWTAAGLAKPAWAASTPLTRWATSRLRVFGAGFLALMLLGALLPGPTPEELALAEAQRAERDSVRAAEQAARDAADARAEAEATADRDSMARVDFSNFYDLLQATAVGPDASGARMDQAIQSGDIVAAYRRAEDLERASRQAWSEVTRMDVPGSTPDSLRDELEEAVGQFADMHLARQQAARDVQEALDGGGVSALADASRSGEIYQAQTLRALAALMAVGMQIDSTFLDRYSDE